LFSLVDHGEQLDLRVLPPLTTITVPNSEEIQLHERLQ
jgi:hypothetical protein